MKFKDREALFLPIVAHAFAEAGLPPELGAAIARQESAFAADAVVLTGGDGKRGGSYGLCQMSLKTGLGLDKGCTAGRLLDANYNAHLAAKLCVENKKLAKGNLQDLISMYNSGKPFHKAPDSTKLIYVPHVQKYMKDYAAQCAKYSVSVVTGPLVSPPGTGKKL